MDLRCRYFDHGKLQIYVKSSEETGQLAYVQKKTALIIMYFKKRYDGEEWVLVQEQA